MPQKKRRKRTALLVLAGILAALALTAGALLLFAPLRPSGRQVLLCGAPVSTMTNGLRAYVCTDALPDCGIRLEGTTAELDGVRADVGALLRDQDGKQYLPVRSLARKFSLAWGLWNGQQYYARRVSLSEPKAGVQVPVFMYHAVGDDCWGEESLFVRPAELEAQLQYLQENGYETIFFEDLSHIEQYEKPVILTFDDGYDDNYTLLLPLLEKYQMKATIFMIGRDIGGNRKLTQEQVLALTRSGLVSIQSHGWSHHEMETMKRPELLKEMFRSRNAIAAASGRVPYAVSYPNGHSSERTRKIAGWFYTYGIRTFEGVYVTGSDSMLIERIAVKRDTTLEAFQAACQSAGQPTALPQQTP